MLRRSALLFIVLAFSSVPLLAQLPNITDVLNAASQDARLAPGTLADVHGTHLGTDASVGAKVGGNPAKVISVDPFVWRILIPFSVQPGPSTVEIGASNVFQVTLTPYAPALFSADQTGHGIVSAQDFPLTSAGALVPPGFPLSAAAANLGDILVLNAAGLGPVDSSNFNDTLDLPVVTLGGAPMLVVFANQVAAVSPDSPCLSAFCTAGMYQVGISLPPAMATGNQPITLTIGGASSQTLTVPINSLPIVYAVANAASGSVKFLAPGSLASVYGTTFGLTDQSSGFPATSFSGVSVAFNGTKAPLLFLGTAVGGAYGQINLQVPAELPESGSATVNVATPGGTSADFTVQMAPAAPGVFVFYSAALPLEREAAVQVAGKNWFVMRDALAADYGIPGNCRAGGVSVTSLCAEPARPGDSIQIYVTGLGKASPNGDPSQATLATGQTMPASGIPPYSPVHQPISVLIGNVSATVNAAVVVPVSFDGVNYRYAGLYRIDVTIPSGIAGDFVQLKVTAPAGLFDAATTIAVHP